MSISIDSARCIGCGACVQACPGNLIKLAPARPDEDAGPRRAGIRRPKDCWGCTSCLKACASGAIAYFLGADIGGRGTTLSVTERGAAKVWTFRHPDGALERIEVDGTQANRY